MASEGSVKLLLKAGRSQIVPLIQGNGIAIGVEYETGIAKIGNQVKAIIST